jgi:3-hydroxy acid dehydrogenase/malonic semialdehyde reductase
MAVSLKHQTVFITGASSGIGKATAMLFAQQGARLILTARRLDRLSALSNELAKQYKIDVLPIELDVRDKQAVADCVASLPNAWRDLDILLNNAGLARESCKMQDGHLDSWETMIATNINGLLYVTHAVLPLMLARKKGHIINIGSIAGREYYTGGNVYAATKHAVKSITESLRLDLLGTGLRVSEIAPGAVHTEFSEVRWQDKKASDDFYSQFTALTADDIAETILFCATRPPHVTIADMMVLSTDQASANHVHRKSGSSDGLLGK